MKKNNWLNFGFQIGAIILALLFTTAVLLMAGAPPLQAIYPSSKAPSAPWTTLQCIIGMGTLVVDHLRRVDNICCGSVEHWHRGADHGWGNFYNRRSALVAKQFRSHRVDTDHRFPGRPGGRSHLGGIGGCLEDIRWG